MLYNGRFRRSVGIVLCNTKGQVLWAKRRGKDAWQFPQGGIEENETPQETLYRELEEEIGLTSNDVQFLGITRDWLNYQWPEVRASYKNKNQTYLGQSQKWFLLKLISQDTAIKLNNTTPPEFDEWKWVNYWYPLDHIVYFKKEIYKQILHELVMYR